MKILLEGRWIDKANKIEVKNPFDNSVVDTVPKADAGDVEKALAYAERGAKVIAKLTGYDRWKILRSPRLIIGLGAPRFWTSVLIRRSVRLRTSSLPNQKGEGGPSP